MILRLVRNYLFLTAFVVIVPAFIKAHYTGDPQYDLVIDQKEFSGSLARALFQDRDGFIWIGTRTGLFRYDGYMLTSFLPDPMDSTTISGSDVISISQDRDGMLWFGTEITGLNRYDPQSSTFKRYFFTLPTSQNSVNTVWGIYHDHIHVWVATRDGLVKLDPQSGLVRRFRTYDEPQNQDQVRANMLRQIRPDPFDTNLIWYTALTGVYTFDKVQEAITPHYTSTLSVLHPLSDETDGQYMYAEFEWMGEEWILGAYGGGHYHYNPKLKTWKRTLFEEVNPNLPLSFNVVLQYEILSDSVLAFSGSRAGLYFPKSAHYILTDEPFESGTIIRFTGDGLLRDREGFVWLGSSDGVRRSHQRLASPTGASTMNIYFPEIRVDDMLLKNTLTNEEVTLLPGQKNLQITYACISPETRDSITYRYRLTGLSEWIDAANNRTVNYTNLGYGTYRFEVLAMHRGTLTALAEASINVFVEEVFWKKPLFLMSFGFLALGLIISGIMFHYRRLGKRLQEKAEFERRLAQSEMAALRAQLNPHFLFNSLNSIKQFIIKSEPRSATRYLNKFAQLMRLALDNSKRSLIPVASELEFLELFLELEQLRLNHKFSFTIDTDSHVDTQSTNIPPLLIQPYVENAIWHGLVHKQRQGNLLIAVYRKGDDIEIRVEDDGVGREASTRLHGANKTRKSEGMRLGEDRVRLLQQMHGDSAAIEVMDLVDPSGEPCGTRVTIRIPIITNGHE